MAYDETAAARWLAEALESGNPLGALPPEIAPATQGDAEAVAAGVLAALGIVACGLRVVLRPDGALAGPMIEGRLVSSGAPVSAATLRHGMATGAVIGVLAEAIEEADERAPVFAWVHPAIDFSSSRFTVAPGDPLAMTADLAGLGLVVAGRGKPMPEGPVRVALGPKGHRQRGQAHDLAALFAEAARVARGWGGLPAGALLVVAGLTGAMAPEGSLRVTISGLGGAEAMVG